MDVLGELMSVNEFPRGNGWTVVAWNMTYISIDAKQSSAQKQGGHNYDIGDGLS